MRSTRLRFLGSLALRAFVLGSASSALVLATTQALLVAEALAADSVPDDDPAFLAMLGSAVTPERATRLAELLRVASEAGGVPGSGAPFFTVLRDTGSPGSPKFEGSGAFDLRPSGYSPLRFENARVVLVPSADGRSCRFELSGSPFGATSKVEATGTIQWKTGPAGGDGLEVEFRLDGAPVDAVRAWVPNRIHESFSGVLAASGKATGVVAEKTTEDAPATPLKGEIQASLDWTAIGRTSPMTIRTQFAIDDRLVRLTNGRMSWLEEGLDLKGWIQPGANDQYELIGSITNVDATAVAKRWNVPPAWWPTATLSGAITFAGTPGKGLLRYKAKAPLVTVPGLGGYDIRIENPEFVGGLMDINAEVAVSVRSQRTVVGGIDLGTLPIGVRWWKNKLQANNSNSTLFGGENDGSLSYDPAKHPEFAFHGRVKNAVPAELLKNVVPWLGMDVDGNASVSFIVEQDAQYAIHTSFHGSLTQARMGGADLFNDTLAALEKADPALKAAPGAVPLPRKGTGMRVDRSFFEAERKGDIIELGGLFLNAGDFRLDADGRFSRAAGLELEGTVRVPASVVDGLVASAPWMAGLRTAGAGIFVPVRVTGQMSALKVELASGYAELIAKAKRGEPVEAPGVRVVRHVGREGLAIIPGDPANEQLQ